VCFGKEHISEAERFGLSLELFYDLWMRGPSAGPLLSWARMIGIRDEADPAGEVYDPTGIDMIEEVEGCGEFNLINLCSITG
jgi:hypothetical protein